MAVVGTLTVDLVAGTASFEKDMTKASSTARRTSKEIQDGFNNMNFGEARGGIMVLGEEIGIHLPRHVQAFVATLPGVGAAMNAAFPVLAVVAIAVALADGLEKLVKYGEKADKVMMDQTAFGAAIANNFRSLDEKLLQAGIHTDELNNNHLAALKKQLELINMQSMSELSHSFDVLAKAADVVFDDLKSHMYSWGIGSDGARHALTQFKTQYDALLAAGRDGDASNLLSGTLKAAQHILDLQQQGAKIVNTHSGTSGQETYNKFKAQSIELAKAGVGVTEKEISSQLALVDALRAQVDVQGKIAALKNAEGGNAQTKNLQDRISLLDRRFAAEKQTIADETKATIAGYQVQYDQGKITAEQLADLKQQTLDKEYTSELAHLEKVKAMEASRAQLVQQTNQKIEALNATHQAQILSTFAATLAKENELNKAFFNAINAEYEKDEALFQKELSAKNKAIVDFSHAWQQGNDKILQLTRDISDQNAIYAQSMAIATGQMTEQKAVQQALATLEKNKVDALANINHELDAQLTKTNALAAAGGTSNNPAYNKAVLEYQSMEDKKLQITKQFNAQIDAERLKAANNERSQWSKMALDFSQLQTHMSQVSRQTLGQMNTSIAQFVVTGTGNFRQLATSSIESSLEMFLQYEESKLMAAVLDSTFFAGKKMLNAADAQSSAATGAAATLADVPYPLNIPASAQVLAVGEAYAADAAAMRGAVLPNREMLVNTHPEEMILPQHISNFVVDAARNASGSGGGQRGPIYVNPVFAPVINTIDKSGVKDMLKTHHQEFHDHLMDSLRRLNY
jgi:lambda family phage tail tape measure protein